MIGLLHPPMGMVLYVLARRPNVARTHDDGDPAVACTAGQPDPITYIPIISLWLPKLVDADGLGRGANRARRNPPGRSAAEGGADRRDPVVRR
jgi:hypothetical protein